MNNFGIQSPYTNNPQKFLNKFSMIVTCSKNGMIGKDNKLSITLDKTIIMGRKTFESLPKGPLPGRLNIILCNDDKNFLKEDVVINKPNTGIVKLSSISEVFNFIHNFEMNPSMNIDTSEFFVIGGGIIYNLFLPYIQQLYLTFVDVEIDGDTKIPNINKYEWDELESIENNKDDKHIYDYIFLKLKKKV